MVKKIYNQPACLVVALGTCKMMAESLIVDQSGTNTITSSDQILVKETTPTDVNVWDNEW